MDLATSPYFFDDLVASNLCGNETDVLSPRASSSLSTGSVVLNPGTPHQTEVCSILSSSCNTLVSNANGDVHSPNTSGKITLNTKAASKSLLYDPFSVSNGSQSGEQYWRQESNSCTFPRNDVQLLKGTPALNVKQSVRRVSSCCNASGMLNVASALMPERMLKKQQFGDQDGRLLHSADQPEIYSLSQIPPNSGYSAESFSGGLAFGGDSVQINNHIAASRRYMKPHVYTNFSKSLQKGFEQKCIQQTLQRDLHMVSDYSSSTSGSHLPVFGLDGNYMNRSSHYIQPNVASNPTSFFHNLSFQPQDQVPQVNQIQLLHDTQRQTQPVENLMSPLTNFEGILHEVSNPKEENLIPFQMSLDQQMQGTPGKMSEQRTSFLPHPFLGGFTNDCLSSSDHATVSNYHNWSPCSSQNTVTKLQDNEKQELLLLYYHARQCPDEGACLNNSCKAMKWFIDHMAFCQKSCSTCFQLHALLGHHRHCQDSNCFVCVPVRKLLCKSFPMRFGMENFNCSSPMISADSDAIIPVPKTLVPDSDQITTLQPFTKRLKTNCTSFESLCQRETSPASKPVNVYVHPSPSEQVSGHSYKSIAAGSAEEIKPFDYSSQGSSSTVCENKIEESEITDEELPTSYKSVVGSELYENFSEHKSASFCKIKIQDPEVCNMVELAVVPVTTQEIVMEGGKANRQVETHNNSQLKDKCNAGVSTLDCSVRTKTRKPNVKGVSLVEAFTREQVLEHTRSLRQWVGLTKAKVAKNQAVEYVGVGDKNSCQLCGMGDLLFEPPPIYCVKCYGRIKHNRAYHTMANSENIASGAGRLYLCNPCFNGSHGDNVTYIGGVLYKAKLEKRRNDVQILELWVQCDKCSAWQHQICALFNSKRNVGEQAEYTCPKCYLQEMEEGEGLPLPHGIILGAHDLPMSKLSDHIESRLATRLHQERQERAKSLQKNLDEVPAAEGLVVRVVSSVDKKLEVKQLFRQIFEEDNYPTEFPYKSKAILLFQKIEGADVCLFGMYVQEYGSACSQPNQRRVCLSYLDSVKYFRPDIKTVTGEALRTFVYHELLIGYLDYCKMCGFTSCHIWSCPPLKQEDFILNCHPEIQKTPKPDKLREWYLAMVRKAVKENIVVENTKLYDFFFVPMAECKASTTASRLPYFDGDYWPGCADDLLQSLQQIEDGKEPQKKGRMTITKRALKAARHGAVTDSLSKDSLLMFKLGEVIRPMKDDLIMIQLQHSCNHCCQMIISGRRWVCSLCKKFQLCDKCYCAEEKLDQKHKHPINSAEKHSLHPVEVIGVPADTVDEDENLESEFFDSRLAFLNLCQGNHYQYDTLRRAKHSTMMILYHLHNPTAPAFVSSCSHCQNDIEMGQGWHCETCPDYDVCNSCYHQEGGVAHAHELVRQTSPGSHDAPQHKGFRQRQALQIQDLLDLLLHAAKCCATHCSYPSCRNVKGLFHHGANCKIRGSGGCASCKKMWYILHLHARACKEGPGCRVPRCRDLKDHLKKMESQSNFRRRFGAMERIRQLETSVTRGDSE